MGGKADIPDPLAVRQQFDAMLREDPRNEDPTMLIKMRALGVSKGR